MRFARGARRAAIARRAGACVLGVVLAATTLGHSSPLAEGAAAVADLEDVLAQPGRALRTAVDALGRGERLLADALLSAVAARHPVIADHTDLLRMRLRVDAERYEEAVAFRRSWHHERSPLRSVFFALLGDAHAALGQEGRARARWEFAALATPGSDDLVALYSAIAASYRRSGALESATEAYLEVWRRHPTAAGADGVTEGIEQIERELGQTVRNADQSRPARLA